MTRPDILMASIYNICRLEIHIAPATTLYVIFAIEKIFETTTSMEKINMHSFFIAILTNLMWPTPIGSKPKSTNWVTIFVFIYRCGIVIVV